MRTREGEILRLERELAATKGELNEAQQTSESKERDARGEQQRLESEVAAAERKLQEAEQELAGLRKQVATLEKGTDQKGRDLGSKEQALLKRAAELEKARLAVEETDEAILRLGLPMAPSVLLQLVGPRVALHVLETLHAAYPDRFPVSQTLANYAEGREQISVVDQSPLAPDEILETALAAIADEIRHLLDEGVVPVAADVDTALILGAGFPFWLGGISKHLEQLGISERMAS